jgi:hypothetical protein
MTTEPEPQSPLSETEKRAAFLAELEAERQRRIEAGKWSRGTLPMLMAVVGDTERDLEAQERALAEHLKRHPDDPRSIHAYQWMLLYGIGPPPIVEPPGAQYGQPDDAIDVTQPTPPPSLLPAPPREKRTYSNAGIPAEIHARALKQLENFESDRYDPQDAPIRYPYPRGRGY